MNEATIAIQSVCRQFPGCETSKDASQALTRWRTPGSTKFRARPCSLQRRPVIWDPRAGINTRPSIGSGKGHEQEKRPDFLRKRSKNLAQKGLASKRNRSVTDSAGRAMRSGI
jgi:hypothetical protein